MDQKTKQFTVKLNFNLDFKANLTPQGGHKKTWLITILVIAFKLLVLYLKLHGA